MVNMNTWTLEIAFSSFPSSFRSPESSELTSVYRNSLNSWRDVKCIPHSADEDAEGTWVEAVERVLLLCPWGHSSWKAEGEEEPRRWGQCGRCRRATYKQDLSASPHMAGGEGVQNSPWSPPARQSPGLQASRCIDPVDAGVGEETIHR